MGGNFYSNVDSEPEVVKSAVSTHTLDVTEDQLAFLEQLTGRDGQDAVEHFVATNLLFGVNSSRIQENLNSLDVKKSIL